MDIIALTRELGKAIQESELYSELQAAKKVNDEDKELQALIEKFGFLNTTYEYEASKDNADEKRCMELEQEIEGLYNTIMQNPNMAKFEIAKNRMDELMNKIVALLAGAVNGDDPMTMDPDKLIHSECGGDCDCCGHHCHDEDDDDCDCGCND